VIPPSFIQDLLSRTDIVEVVGRHVQLKKAGINYKGLCPFHGEKSPSFIVSPSRQTYHCFGCGVHGNAVGFLMEHSALGFIDAVKELAQGAGLQVPDDDRSPAQRAEDERRRERQATLTEVLEKAATHWKQQLKASPRAVSYLKGRGLTGAIAARFSMGYAPDNWRGLASVYPRYDDPLLVETGLVITQGEDGDPAQKRYDRFRDRIMFPIRNVKGEVIAFGGRVLDQGEPKYLNSPETPVFVKGRELYGLFEARHALREKGYALVTEGYMDVVALAQLGFGNAVATLGTACTAEHVHKLLRFTDQVVFSFDGDAAGRRAAGRALEAALPHATDTRSFRFLFLPAEHDPDSYIREFGPEAFERCVQEAVPLSRQLVEVAREGADTSSVEGRAKMLSAARPLWSALPDGVLKRALLEELAQLGGLSREDVLQLWQAAAAPRGAGRGARPRGGEDPGGDWTTHDEPPPGDWDGGGAGADLSPWDVGAEGAGAGGGEGGPGRGDWKGRRQGGWKPGAGGRGPWKGRRWRDEEDTDPWNAGRMGVQPLRGAASLLDRALWVLVHRHEAWDALGGEAQALLAEQPAPHGPAFSLIERRLHDEGALSATSLLEALRGEGGGAAALAGRVADFLDPLPEVDLDQELRVIVDRLLLQAVKEELAMLFESGALSEDATRRSRELIRRQAELHARVTGPAAAEG
jgi:DNA primase